MMSNDIKVSAKLKREELKSKGIFHSNNDFALIVKDRLDKISGVKEYKEIVDICVGAGNLLNVFDCEKYGIDLEQEFVEIAKEAGVNAYCGNTLTMDNPFGGDFDFIVGNYPFSLRDETIAKECHKSLTSKEFFKSLPQLSNILDSAFICKNIEYLSDNGKGVIVGFPGILYRGKKEQDFREWLVNKGILRSIEIIQGKFFDDTNTQVVIFSIDKTGGYNEIEFINSIDGVSKKATIEEIKEKDYNLSPNRYVTKEVEKEDIDIKGLNHSINLSCVNQVKNQLQLNKLIDSLEDSNLYFELIEMLEKTIKEHKAKKYKIPKEKARAELLARTLFDF